MKPYKLKTNLIICFLLISISAFGQCKFEVVQPNEDSLSILLKCHENMTITDSTDFWGTMVHTKYVLKSDTLIYVSCLIKSRWPFLILYKSYAIRPIKFETIAIFKPNLFKYKLKSKNCIEVHNDGIEILFDDPTIPTCKIEYKELETKKLKDILSERGLVKTF